MAVKIRLTRRGRKNRPYYRVVVADSRAPRDGRFIETLGIYHPLNKNPEEQVKINDEKVLSWLRKGAVPSDTVRSLLRKKGVLKAFHEEKVAAKKAEKAKA